MTEHQHNHGSAIQTPLHGPPQGYPPQGYPPQGYPHGHAPVHPGAHGAGYPPPTAQPVNIVVQNTMSQGHHYPQQLVKIADRQKGLAVLLALFLGGLGVHRFYLGQTAMGVLYLLLSWTFIPMFIALIEALLLLMMSQREFDMKYNMGFG